MKKDQVKSVLFGVAVGDAVGVPFEFRKREVMLKNPATDMVGFGTYNQSPGTFSDDSSLTFCLAEALTHGFDLQEIAINFIKWVEEDYWTAHGELFDIGIATHEAILNLRRGDSPEISGGDDEYSNGNGSLMRIAPLLFYLLDKPIQERFELTRLVSGITHRHIRSVVACFFYLEFARFLVEGLEKQDAYKKTQVQVFTFLKTITVPDSELELFDRLLCSDISQEPINSIESSGYVIHTLEASIWCLLTTETYQDAILKAVNLGKDTDTTAAVTGGLAGLLYGVEGIPDSWINQLAKRDEIEDLAERMALKIYLK
jgi:ADP-ribosyl-[dinitrogen reductase] hydrolase